MDDYGRKLKGLRLSLTARCNLSCFYCHGEGQAEGEGELSLKEIDRLAENFARIGVDNVKLTGGEPLLRDEISSIAKSFTTRGIETGITTNGTLLLERIEGLVEAGVSRINVNLPSVEPRIYEMVTGRDMCTKVIEGCRRAREGGLDVKFNVVVLRGLNDGIEHATKMLEIARASKFNIQFIELEAPSNQTESGFYARHHVSLNEIENWLSGIAVERTKKEALHNTSIYILEDGTKVEIVSPMGNPEFCNRCTRLRITASGKIKPCLFLPAGQSIRELLDDFPRFKAVVEGAWLQRKPYFR
ncbi:MAG: GTP 3',8-cyclase MoaA [Thermoplasmata archaeon]|nr:GTP 3',8-cyclase MoaA [Thermoplasmata archaeon]